MTSSNKIFTITEYGRFSCNKEINGYVSLPEEIFNSLEEFILSSNEESQSDALEFMSLSSKPGIGKIITAKNYVGVIAMKDGTVIEILPKIVGSSVSANDTRNIFMEMLRTLREFKFKEFNYSNFKDDKINIFEVFIKMFLNEVLLLTKRGLRAAYIPIESNEKFYKGKLLTSMNIKHNLINKERFYVSYDEFNFNRAENRLIKSTIGLVSKLTSDSRNRQIANQLITFFDGIEFSKSYVSDFNKCISERGMEHYSKALSWCRIFLKGNSFTPFLGKKAALALLFPMEKVFESYMASKFRKNIGNKFTLKIQDNKYSLFDKPSRVFSLRPDLVLETDTRKIILDTKWKILSNTKTNKSISQADMYQMYAYSKKYQADKVILLYPQSDYIDNKAISFEADDDVKVEVSFVDLLNVDEYIKDLVSLF